ncbi:hypothetical protein [Pseudomonas neuropathica]|uniref:hypothetical protein n=1 Tax=Pseudomonas neuropathica TaxID=2730425 RepID=UPI003EBCAD3F
MNNQQKADYLLEAISKLDSAQNLGRVAEYPYRKSLRERIKRVLVDTRAERLTEEIQDKYVPETGIFLPAPITVIAEDIKASTDKSLLDVFKGKILELEMGL